MARAHEVGPALCRDHLRAAPAFGPPAGSRPSPPPDPPPEGGGDRSDRDREPSRHPVHARLLPDRAGGFRPIDPRRPARGFGDLPRQPLRLRTREARRPGAPVEDGTECGFVASAVEEVLFEGEPISSTRIRKAIARGNVKRRTRCSGANTSSTASSRGATASGARSVYPTINLEPENELHPADGVYVTQIQIRSFGRRSNASRTSGAGRRSTRSSHHY